MSRPPAQPPRTALARPVRLREAADLGLARAELSSERWTRFDRGVRLHGSLDRTDPMLRIRALLEWLPPWATIGGWASLRWQGVTALDGRTGPGGETLLPILVHVGPERHLRQRSGLVVDRSRVAADDTLEVGGARVTTATRAVFDEMCRGGPEDGMVAGDAAWKAGATSGPQVVAYAEEHPRVRGVPAARLAAPLLDPRVKSCMESRLRFVWVVVAGCPAPLVNRLVTDDTGFVVGESDLFDVEAALVGEYDGSSHRTLAQHTADNAREEAFERLNLTVVRATAIDVFVKRRELVRRILAGRADGLARDRSKDRWGVRVLRPSA